MFLSRLRSSSISTLNRLSARYFHDCSVSDTHPVRLLLLGSPGSGKGTQSNRLKANFGVTHLSSGDLLRRNINQKTPAGLQAGEYVANGQLVPDEVMLSLIDTELEHLGNPNWLLDGFPRSLLQAKTLDMMLQRLNQPLTLVINLEVPEEVILERIMDRWVHVPSGRVYNLSYNPPRTPGLDDITGEPLSKRPDDTPEVFRVRMQQYKTMAAPLLDHYSDIAKTISGRTSDEIYPQIEREIVNRLGVVPGSLRMRSTSSMAVAAVSRHKRDQQRKLSIHQQQHQVEREPLTATNSQ